ncbi:MAG: ThuA domain-containing protein [Thermogutta sp.]
MMQQPIGLMKILMKRIVTLIPWGFCLAMWSGVLTNTNTVASAAESPQGQKKIVFIAGHPSHGFGSHEHNAGCLLLAKKLKEALPDVETVVYTNGWPQEKEALAKADAVVIFADGGGGNIIAAHLNELQRAIDEGAGLVVLHYALDIASSEGREKLKSWIGGYYETYWSVNPHWRAEFKDLPEHPITRGVRPFAIDDEWYYHMRFVDDMKNVSPILTAVPPDSTRERPDGPHSGNPAVRARKGMPEHVAWAYERPKGGRGFGFTGGHHHWNWAHDQFRRLVLNAIAWCADIDIPQNGLQTKTPTMEELLANLDEPQPGNFQPGAIQERIENWNR